jgi:anti-sigma regulatory factor (Ser/Thr protein kinase)
MMSHVHPELQSRNLAAAAGPVRLNITSDPANLAPVRKAVEDLAGASGFDASAVGDIALCVNEALANVMRHAYGGATDRPIEVAADVDERAGGAMRIRIRDWGNGVNPEELPHKPHDPLTPGGLGMICLRKMMDDVHFTPQPDGMLLEMSRRRRRPVMWLFDLIRNWKR